ncbi:hypothetical protein Tsubulata_023004 [Turnera subulata]|uniref:Vta1/callose synthase N-terminal domain-containing protein n=1 Tax=Turnera subulata TaxID=218843 RepID=A0A9Q0F8F1_9ROSI|nr:hypothetical protein Tsubulata_023004 [Turnera subulata]
MSSETEPAKLLLPYLQRADELQKHEPLVAYYCRLYAMEKGLKIPPSERTKTTNALLVSLMNQLEKDKKSVKLGPEDNLHVEGFALSVFGKADKQDRAGRADLNTAKTFYAASIFFEILNQFGALQPDIEQKQKYAVWKAADIRKALKEGRRPNPGPPDGDDNLSIPSSGYDIGSSDATAYHGGESELPTQSPDQVIDQHSTNIPPSPQFHDKIDNQHPAHVSPPPQFHDSVDGQHSTNFHDKIDNQHPAHVSPPPQFHDSVDGQHSTNVLPSPPSYPTAGYPSQEFHPPPAASRSENSMYSQQYHPHQSYLQDPHLQQSHSYPSHEPSPYNYPNFQSYPSFTESSLPSAPSHYPSYYQGSDSSYSPQSAPTTTSYSSNPAYPSSSINRTNSDPAPAPTSASTPAYQYDSNYQPAPEKIAEAHKAARFAVGALAFDEHSTNIPPSPQFHDKIDNQHPAHVSPPPQFHDSVDGQHSTNVLPSPPSYPTAGYPSQEFHPPPAASRSENSMYSQHYHPHQSYLQDPHLQQSHSYPSHEPSPYNYPNFQSCPSLSLTYLPWLY